MGFYLPQYCPMAASSSVLPVPFSAENGISNIYKSFTPPQKGVGKMLTGDSRTAAAQAVDVLAAKHII